MRACPPQNQCQSGDDYAILWKGWKHIMNEPCLLSIIAKGYRLYESIPSAQDPWEVQISKGSLKIQGMRKQLSLMLQKNES